MSSEEEQNKEYYCGDEILVEVDVGDDLPPDDESIWSEVNDDNVEEQIEGDANDADLDENIEDMASFTFGGHGKESVYCIANHPSIPGMVISGGGDDTAYIWNFSTPLGETTQQYLFALSGHKDSITSVGFNFDGSMALTGSYDGTVRVWNVNNGEMMAVLEGPEDIEWALWHSKGNAIIAGSRDGTVWMWLAPSGQCMQVFAGHDGGVPAGCFSSDGKFICSGGEDGTVRIWAPKTGQCKHVFEGHFGHEGAVTTLSSNPHDGDMLASGSVDGKVRVYHIGGKKVLLTLVHSTPNASASNNDLDTIQEDEDTEEVMSVEAVGFSAAEWRWIASGGMDSTLKIWDQNSGLLRCVCQHKQGVVALQWHNELALIATGSLDRIVRLWDARNGSPLVEFTGHRDMIIAIDMKMMTSSVFSSNMTDAIVSASDDGTVKVFQFNHDAVFSS